MTDRELLEKAAKAAGVLLEGVEQDGRGVTIRGTYWQPLHDDGDALRLAVKQRLQVDFGVEETTVWYDSESDGAYYLKEPSGGDPYAATRRAIVRAAAQMAKDGE